MRIQETNKLINESKLRTRQVEQEETRSSMWKSMASRIREVIPPALRDRRMIAGVAALATVSAGAIALNNRRGSR